MLLRGQDPGVLLEFNELICSHPYVTLSVQLVIN